MFFCDLGTLFLADGLVITELRSFGEEIFVGLVIGNIISLVTKEVGFFVLLLFNCSRMSNSQVNIREVFNIIRTSWLEEGINCWCNTFDNRFWTNISSSSNTISIINSSIFTNKRGIFIISFFAELGLLCLDPLVEFIVVFFGEKFGLKLMIDGNLNLSTTNSDEDGGRELVKT